MRFFSTGPNAFSVFSTCIAPFTDKQSAETGYQYFVCRKNGGQGHHAEQRTTIDDHGAHAIWLLADQDDFQPIEDVRPFAELRIDSAQF